MSAERFFAVERERARLLCGRDSERDYRDLGAWMARIADVVRPVPLLFVLIPDELQVEDALWARIAVAEGPLERDQGQRRLGAWLAARGLPYVDLLPRLRAVPPLPDGGRHVYHLRDTHFNARGNRVAGEALAEALRALPRAGR